MTRPRSLTDGSISGGLARFALPMLLANVLQTVNGTVNSFWVGRFLGEAALTASSNANMVMFLLIGVGFGIALAATILIGQRIGAHDLQEAKRVVGTGATFFAIFSIVVAVAGLMFCRPILVGMHTPVDAFALAVAYLRIIFLAMPFIFLNTFVISALRGAGDSKTPFLFMAFSVAIDVGLNPVFIFGVGPIPRLGIAGSALATLVAQAVGVVALLVYLYRTGNPLCLRGPDRSMLRLNGPILRTLIVKGVPMGAQILVLSLSGVLMISLVNRFGVDTAAAYGAGLQVWNYIQMPAFAIGMGVSAMAAQNVGARKWDRVRKVARVGVAFNVVMTGAIVIVIELLDRGTFRMFLPADSAALAVAGHMNRIATSSFIFFGISMVLSGVVRATGAVIPPLVILSVAMLGVRFPMAEAFLGRFGIDAIWWSFPISAAVSAILATLYYKYGGWRSAHMMVAAAPTPERALGTADVSVD